MPDNRKARDKARDAENPNIPSSARWRRTLPLAAAALAWTMLAPDVQAAADDRESAAKGPETALLAQAPAATGSAPAATDSIVPAPPVNNGPKIRVRDIEIRGNRTVTDETILLTLPIHRGEDVSREQVLESLQRIYGLGYFLDVKASTEPVPGGERLVFHVVENPPLKEVRIEGETVFPEAELAQPFQEMKGKVVNFRDVQQVIKQIEKKYADQGYVLARVLDLNTSPDGILTIKLAEGTVSAIRIEGNEETQEYVIRRELTQRTGELFNWKRMEEDLRRVYNLNFFEDIGIRYEPGETPDKVTVVINVKEKQTGTFNLSAGWSNRDGLLGVVGFRKENFLGRAQSVSTDLTISQRNWAAEISYFNPWIDDRKTSFGTNLYARRFWNFFGQINDPTTGTPLNGFLEERRGGVVSFGRPLFGDPITAQWRGALRFRAESIGLLTTDQARSLEGPTLFASGGSSDFATTAGFTATFDSRDYVINPTRGWFNTYAVEQYLPGLSTLNLSRVQLDMNHYFPIWSNHTLAAGWKLGTLFSATGGFVPPYERFFSTGSNLIRGWPENPGAGALGQFPYGSFSGDSFTLASAEYRFPIVNILSGVVFGDTGIFWDHNRRNFSLDRTRSGYGAGLRINTPLGPLRLDYGLREWNLNAGVVHFSIGQKF